MPVILEGLRVSLKFRFGVVTGISWPHSECRGGGDHQYRARLGHRDRVTVTRDQDGGHGAAWGLSRDQANIMILVGC